MRAVQRRKVHALQLGGNGQHALGPLRLFIFLPRMAQQHRANARMGVLHVINGVFVVLGQRQVDVKDVFGVGLAAEQEETHRVGAGPLDQVAQSDVAAGAFGDFHLFAVAHHAHHGVQHVVGVTGGHAGTGGLQAGAHAGDGAVVVHALNVDGLGITALPLGQVVGHVRHKVGVAAVALFHDAVFVVAVVGRFEPQRAVLLIGLAGSLKPFDC